MGSCEEYISWSRGWFLGASEWWIDVIGKVKGEGVEWMVDAISKMGVFIEAPAVARS